VKKIKSPKVNKTLGAVIREARGKMPLVELAKRIKTHSAKGFLNVGYLSHIESDRQIPSIEILDQFAKELKIDRQLLYDLAAQAVLQHTFAKSTSTEPIKISVTINLNKLIKEKFPKVVT